MHNDSLLLGWRRDHQPVAGPQAELARGHGVFCIAVRFVEILSMVLSLLAYFFTMITSLTVLASVWIGLVDGPAFQRAHLQSYPRPVITEVASAPVKPPKGEVSSPSDAASANGDRAKHMALGRTHARSLLGRHQHGRENSVALGYPAEPGAIFSPTFPSPAVAPIYPASEGQRALD